MGVTQDAFKPDMLMEDFNKLDKKADHKEKIDILTKRAKQYLLFMISRWEMKAKPIKRVAARYVVGEEILSCFLICEVPKIIASLYQ